MAHYTTYYISTSGQPATNEQAHDTLGAALDSWLSNCTALPRLSGGRSTLRDESGDMLVWLEHCNGAYPLVDALAMDGSQDDDVSTPAAVYALYKATLV
jgi:hypothetical protein